MELWPHVLQKWLRHATAAATDTVTHRCYHLCQTIPPCSPERGRMVSTQIAGMHTGRAAMDQETQRTAVPSGFNQTPVMVHCQLRVETVCSAQRPHRPVYNNRGLGPTVRTRAASKDLPRRLHHMGMVACGFTVRGVFSCRTVERQCVCAVCEFTPSQTCAASSRVPLSRCQFNLRTMIGHEPSDTGALLGAEERSRALRAASAGLGVLCVGALAVASLQPVVIGPNAVQAAAATTTCANGFPSDFVWGLGTASYQIEGGWNLTNRQPSIWDTFSHEKGHVYGDETGDVADDVFHLWRSDIQIMVELGLKHYRFSLSWSRMMSWDGTTMVPNEPGIKWYDDFLNGLLAAGITPHITLYHWDLPQALHDHALVPRPCTTPLYHALVPRPWDLPQALHDHKGGWHTPDNEPILAEFEKYASLAFERFGGRVATWFTFNE
eukprot:1358343-Prymnesium_polylepis.2